MTRAAVALAAALLLGAPLAFADGTGAGARPRAKAKALFESTCSACHPLSRPLSRNRDREGWTETVTQMRKVNGCDITDAEASAIIDYLARIRGPRPGGAR